MTVDGGSDSGPLARKFEPGDTRYELALDEARARLDYQREAVNGLRTRAAALLTAINISTSFLAGLAIVDKSLGPYTWVAVGLFVGSLVACLLVIWPWEVWQFHISGNHIIKRWIDAEGNNSLPALQYSLANMYHRHYNDNKKYLKRLAICFQISATMLALEIVGWLVALLII